MSEKKVKKNKIDLAKELAKTLSELEQVTEMERVIKDNKIIFRVKDQNYQVRRANYEEQLELEKFRREKYLDYLNDSTMIFKKQLIEKLKLKDVDIAKMEAEIIQLETKKETIQFNLAKTANEIDVNKLKSEISKILLQQSTIHIEVTDLLSYSIEAQLTNEANSYYTYLVLEKEISKDKFVRLFKTYEEFLKSQKVDLINRAFYNANRLIYQPNILGEDNGKNN